jgi:predicted transcriptional regulator
MDFNKLLQSGIAPFVQWELPVPTTAPANTALSSLQVAPSGSLMVVNPTNQQLSGIITSSDVPRAYLNNNLPETAVDLATRRVVAIKDNAQLWQLLKIMNGENDLHRPLDVIPVVDADNRPIGIIKREKVKETLQKMENED